MKKTKSIRLFLGLVLTIILNVACFPIGVLAENQAEQGTLIPIIVFSSDPVYNGNPQVLAVVNPAVDGPDLNPERIEITYKGIQANGETYPLSTIPPSAAGTYMVFVGYRGDDAYQSIDDKKEIKIKPIELKTTEFFTEKPITKIYDGNTSAPENALKGLGNTGVVDADINEVTFNYKSASFLFKDVKPVNSNLIILKDMTVSGDKGKNYIIVDEKKEIKPLASIDISLVASILPKPVQVLITGQDKVYDGTPNLYDYQLSVTKTDLIQGEELGAFGSEKFYPYYGDINVQQKAVGSYYVWATGGFYLYGINGTNADNYTINNQTVISKKKYDITPASVTVIPASVSKIQGEADPALTYTVWQDDAGDGFNKGLYADDVMFGSLEREAGEAVGSYDIFLGSLNNANYRIVLVDGTDKFEIIKKEDAVAVYGGNDYSNGENGATEKETESPVPYMGIALLLLLLIAGAVFFGKNRLTKMD
ncbi:MAG: MBG domain-containing protein [Acetobacterium sp.]|uniref:MBG domain-containing protein n=1 Tax=Acetobacterium sp. TaxID=1872094 RepID=UPI003242E111